MSNIWRGRIEDKRNEVIEHMKNTKDREHSRIIIMRLYKTINLMKAANGYKYKNKTDKE